MFLLLKPILSLRLLNTEVSDHTANEVNIFYFANALSCFGWIFISHDNDKNALMFFKRLKEEILNAFRNNKLRRASIQSADSEKHIKKCFDPTPSFCYSSLFSHKN